MDYWSLEIDLVTRRLHEDPRVAEEAGGSPEIILEIRMSIRWILGPRIEPRSNVGIQRFYDRSENLSWNLEVFEIVTGP